MRPFKRMVRIRSLAMVLGLGVLSSSASYPTHAYAAQLSSTDPTSPRPLLQVAEGSLLGAVDGTTAVFKGIPYAAAPTGLLRWRAPQPAAHWSGVRDASKFGSVCAQPADSFFGNTVGSEDCLTLNVWAPHREPGQTPLPVMFFIHGGFFVEGSGSSQAFGVRLFDGRKLAEKGQVVIVTINYRLGQLGFLAHRALDTESGHGSGNYGFLDQIAALQWVQANIGAFGGDPAQVTLFGQSSGAASIAALLTSPLLRDHPPFARAIIQSVPELILDWTRARSYGDRLVADLGCESSSPAAEIQCLRKKKPEDMINALPESFDEENPVQYGPNLDFSSLSEFPSEAFRLGHYVHVPILLGTTANEMSTLLPTIHPAPIDTDQKLQDIFYQRYGFKVGQKIQDLYSPYHYGNDDRRAAVAAFTDEVFTCPARRMARQLATRGIPVWRYVFKYAPSPYLVLPYGPGHGLDLPFVFGNFPNAIGLKPDGEDRKVAEAISEYWTSFAHGSAPASAHGIVWPQYDPAHASTLLLDSHFKVADGLRDVNCDYWDKSPFQGSL